MLWLTLQQLKSQKASVRLKAVEKLIAMDGASAALAPLLTVTRDPDVEVRKKVMGGLGAWHQAEGVVGHLILGLKDPDAGVREAAASSLRAAGDKRSVSVLEGALKDSDSQVRWQAALALDAMGWEAKTDDLKAKFLVSCGKLMAAAALGSKAVDPIIGVLKDGVYYKKLEAVEALLKINDVRVVTALVPALKDLDSNVRSAAVEALGLIGDARAVEPLIRSLKDVDSKVRRACVEALSKLGDLRAIPALLSCLKDNDWSVRVSTVESLGRLKDSRVFEPLSEALKDSDSDIRQMAVTALGKHGDRKAIEFIVPRLADRDEAVRQAAASVLPKLHREWIRSSEARRAIPSLEKAAKDDDYWVQQAALKVLSAIQGGKLLPKQVASDSKKPSLSDRAKDNRSIALEILKGLVTDQDRDVRQAAAEALGRVGDTQSAKILEELFGDSDEWVGRAAAQSLEGLSWVAGSDELRVRHLYLLRRWDDLVDLGETAVDVLVEGLKDKESRTRRSAAMALGMIGCERALGPLVGALNDPYRSVREAITEAVQEIGLEKATLRQQAMVATELQDWEKLRDLGVDAIPSLIEVVRNRREQPEMAHQAEIILSAINLVEAFDDLVKAVHDKEVAVTIVGVLSRLVDNNPTELDESRIQMLIDLPVIYQYRYEMDEVTGGLVRRGTEEVDTTELKIQARAALEVVQHH